MSRLKTRRILAALAIVLAVLIFFVSAQVLGPWWRNQNMPTPEEWSAFFGAFALVALGFAWYQIRQVDQSNRELIASNELARQVNLEVVRPRVQVYLRADRHVGRQRGGPSQGTVYIALTNTGASQAREVRLTVQPAFDSLDEFFQPGKRTAYLNELNSLFDGSARFDSLKPGAQYIYFLGRVPELFDAQDALPQKYEITASYKGTGSQPEYNDEFTIDLSIERHLDRPVDGLTRIGRDLEVIGDKLDIVRKSIDRVADASENEGES